MRGPLCLLIVAGLAGCGSARRPPSLPAGARPVGPGPRFQPRLTDAIVRGCRPGLGRRVGVHLELFAERFVVIFPSGIGTQPPRHFAGGRIARARCYGPLVTIDPTGLVLLRPGTLATVGDLFTAWGRPLRPDGAAGFRGRVRAWVGGREWHGAAAAIPLRRHAEIVIEIGGYVVPHPRYTFPAGF